jgi:hypothetical protein
MSSSLKEQLLKAGLVKPAKANKKAKKKAPTPAKKNRKKVGETTLRAQRAMLDKAKKDRKLNEQRQAEAERKARYAQIKQLVDASKLDRKDGEKSYNFTFNKKVKTIYVTDEQHSQLSKDQLAIIVMEGERYELVPVKVAEQIATRESHRVIRNKSKSQASSEDDPYADYQIPDDLVW